MRMNSTCYKQYDTRWSGLPYPRKPWYIRNCGCGEVSICNAIIEMATQAGQTPKTIQPYMKQYAESRGNGTFHYGIPAAMKHYGLTEVAEHATMQKLWNELKKGGRVAILLMGKRNAGSKGVHWTGSGHFVAVTAYKEEGGKHWVYVKDSASTSSLRNGWITYEDNIRNACLKCWSGKLNGEAAKTPASPGVTPDGKLTIDGIGGPSTVRAMQRFFGTPQDGIIGGQNQSCAKWYPALKSVKYGKGGSPCIRNLQRWVGVTIDGVWGKNTSKALQKKLGMKEDGIFGAGSMKAWQMYLNANDKAVYPPTPAPAPQTRQDKMVAWAKAIAADNRYHYVKWNSKVEATHTCPICKGRKYNNYFGWNCIGFAYACWHHGGGLSNKCNCGVISNEVGTKMLATKSTSKMLEMARSRIGLHDIQIIYNGGKHIPTSMLKAGDILLQYSGSTYVHTFLYIGNGQMAHAQGSNGKVPNDKQICVQGYPKSGCKIAIRYTGK